MTLPLGEVAGAVVAWLGQGLRGRAGLSLLTEVAGRALAFLFFVIVARHTNPGVFGAVRYITAAGFLGAALGLPFLVAFGRDYGTQGDRARAGGSQLHDSLTLHVYGWFGASIVGAVVAGISVGRDPETHVLVGLCAVAAACNYFTAAVTRTCGWISTLAWATILGNAGQLGLLALAIGCCSQVDVGVVVTFYCIGFVAPVILFPRLRRSLRIQSPPWLELLRAVRQERKDYLALGLFQGTHVAMTVLDVVVLGTVAAPNAVGEYAVARSLGALVLVPVGSLYYLLLPRVTGNRGHVLAERIDVLLWTGWAGTALAATVLALLAPVAVPLIYGRSYGAAVVPTVLMAGATGLYAVVLLRSAIWVGRGAAAQYGALAALATALNAVLLLVIRQAQSATGAAVVALVVSGLLAGAVFSSEQFILGPARARSRSLT